MSVPPQNQVHMQQTPEGIVVEVRARAGARRNGVDGIRDGAILVAVTQAPERGKANEAILEELARFLGVKRSAVRLISGATSPRKRFLILGTTREFLLARMTQVDGDG